MFKHVGSPQQSWSLVGIRERNLDLVIWACVGVGLVLVRCSVWV